MSERHSGTVVWFDAKKGYGFIEPEAGGAPAPADGHEDIFVHHSGIAREMECPSCGHRNLTRGQRVTFELSEQEGKMMAVRVLADG